MWVHDEYTERARSEEKVLLKISFISCLLKEMWKNASILREGEKNMKGSNIKNENWEEFSFSFRVGKNYRFTRFNVEWCLNTGRWKLL